ncbi:flavodoxin family protein [Geobacter grbiciae]|uniref:flavodoxin family protein n=1 Tax=Geobacter grbiciae TaxID=155042 RepID=UPI001C00BB9C|nr:flavodoxin family protein [Geobacter grbiciae]MBT1075633.1 flavodoxin family protein [Geobacter grbiciae]
MKVLGISCSPRPGQTTDRLVQEVLNNIEAPTEFVSLSGRRIGPCLGCLGCVADNVCKVRDDMGELRPLIVEADALVIGAPNYFGMLNGLAHCFLERLYQFRHQEGGALHGKLGVAVGVGSAMPDSAVRDIEKFFSFSRIEPVGNVTAIGPASCFNCGHGEECREGAIHRVFGPGTKITADLTPNLSKQPDSLTAARMLGEKLTQRLKQG